MRGGSPVSSGQGQQDVKGGYGRAVGVGLLGGRDRRECCRDVQSCRYLLAAGVQTPRVTTEIHGCCKQ